ncbi:SDR family oxidoreductase [Streptomyces broussonetiae]|uniref:SDR family oxidoreductase n=1 Tax=Streptomyces broussonetiae TaxID=2686304 RepID=UPI002D7F6C9E|nr:SDR family oxidoreductase [Streptomyces broussonetiae]
MQPLGGAAEVEAVKYGVGSVRTGGSVVLTTGTAGQRPLPGSSAVSALCGAMESRTRAPAVEGAPVRVNVVSPGVVRTELWREAPEADREELFRSSAESLPVGRVGEPADVAEAYLYLMRGGCSTGSVVVVDGGGTPVRAVRRRRGVRRRRTRPSPAGGSRAGRTPRARRR